MRSDSAVRATKQLYWQLRRDPLQFPRRWARSLRIGREGFYWTLRGRANAGTCTICERATTFVRRDDWLRDGYLCIRCHSIPRFRAVIHVLQTVFPDFRQKAIHESSPSGPASAKLRAECALYSASQFFPDIPRGESRDEIRCENLEALTFPDATFDLFVTQDVLEHVMNPAAAFAEIARVLKPGGAHVFTVPYYGERMTFVRAMARGNEIVYLAEKDYHKNPIDDAGSLVVTEWGKDLPAFILAHSGLSTTSHLVRDPDLGLDGEFLEVFVSRKPDHAPGSREI